VALLLEHGSSVDVVDCKGQTPLFCAVKNWDTDSCIALLHAGASPDGDRRNLSTPLHIACQDGYAVGVKVHSNYNIWEEITYFLSSVLEERLVKLVNLNNNCTKYSHLSICRISPNTDV
jgi:ankyrin repeat protein